MLGHDEEGEASVWDAFGKVCVKLERGDASETFRMDVETAVHFAAKLLAHAGGIDEELTQRVLDSYEESAAEEAS